MAKETKILLVDDEENILNVYSAMLAELGYSTETASKPDKAVRLVQEHCFSTVFLDQFLGPVTGLNLMQQLSQINPEMYFVIMTANDTTSLAVESLKKGASDFIAKPFSVSDLIKSIEYVNKKRELDRQRKEMLATLESRIEEKSKELNNTYFSVLSSLAQAMEKKDLGTYGHSRRVRHYAKLVAAALDLSNQDRENLKAAAMLHDIGKIGASDLILGKQGPLTKAEMNVIKGHPEKGVEILRPLVTSFRQFESILPTILHHHENYDGSGYPEGLSGENIPLPARIIAVADTYDAILSNRPYRSANDHAFAVRELTACSGKQFDPEVVHAFVGTDAQYRRLFGDNSNIFPRKTISHNQHI
jgi:putative nucleotidyltransferase with HDIG domain